MMRWMILGLLAVLAGYALGFSNTQRIVDDKYRWHFQTPTVASTDIAIRFPKIGTANTHNPAPGNERSVDFVELAQFDLAGGNAAEFIVFSSMFPAGADTVRLNGNVRTRIVSGVKIDSLRYIGTLAIPTIGVTAGGAY